MCPQRSAFFFGNPQPHNVLNAIEVHTNCHVRGLVDNPATIADFNAQRIQEDNGVELTSLAVLPDHDLIADGISDRGHCFMRDIYPHRCCHMMLDIPNGQSAGI